MEPVLEAFSSFFQNESYIGLMIVGSLVGLVIGALPGLGGSAAIAMLLPITFGMEPAAAIILLVTAYGSTDAGGCIPAILINTPGSAENASTTIDGYPMAQQGRAGEAIGAAMMSGALGCLLGFITLLVLVPVSRSMILAFSYPEFFMMSLFGLTIIITLTEGNRVRGIVAAGLGVLLALVGREPIYGSARFTFNNLYLDDGFKTIPVIIGVMALSQAIVLFTEKKSVASGEYSGKVTGTGILDGCLACFKHWGVVVRSSLIGIIVGVTPGIGATVAGFLAYGQTAQLSKHPERFGKGAVEGVIASEAAHNSKEGGALLPTVAFGIPGSSGMAVLMGALVLHGIVLGPETITKQVHIVWLLIIGWFVGGVFAAFSGAIFGKYLVPITKVPSYHIAPSIVILSVVGAYAIDRSALDVVALVIFGILGYEMKKFGFSRIALVIGFVLGSLVESTYHQTLQAMGYSAFFTRPISLGLFIATIIAVVYPIWVKRRRNNITYSL